MSDPYRSPFWLPGSHAQTMYPYLFLRGRPVPLRRERLDTPDGDVVDVDWLDGPPDAPTLVLFHGLEGSSRSHYATAILAAAAARGWRGVVPHWRGCGGEPNRLPRAYHSGDYAEVDWMLAALRPRFGSAPMAAVGVSLGGSALLNWLGREGEKSRAWLKAAAALSAPIDLMASGSALDRGWNRIYARNFLRTLVPKAIAKEHLHPGIVDAAALARVRSMRAFDDVFTAPLHGFRDVTDYWTRGSSMPWLATIRLPTLLLNARNDPFIPGASLPGPGDVSADVTLDQPACGGHVGFTSGGFPGGLDWLCARVLGFIHERLANDR
ncbi:MAG TPA: hydrolase [Planctomycetota bacterium]|nr:hydrolase [Planctomycetota bacterium]